MPLNVDLAMLLAAGSLHAASPNAGNGEFRPGDPPTCSFGYAAAFLIDFRLFPAYTNPAREAAVGSVNHFFTATGLSAYQQASGNPVIERILVDCDPARPNDGVATEDLSDFIAGPGEEVYYSQYEGFIDAFVQFELAPLDSNFFAYASDHSYAEMNVYGFSPSQARFIGRLAALIRTEAALRRAVDRGDHEDFLAALDRHTRSIVDMDSDNEIPRDRSGMWPPAMYPDGLRYMVDFSRKHAILNLVDIFAYRMKSQENWWLSPLEARYLLRILDDAEYFQPFTGGPQDPPGRDSGYSYTTAAYWTFLQDFTGDSDLTPSYEYSPFLWARSRKAIANMTRVYLDRKRSLGAYAHSRVCFVEANLQLAESVFAGTVFNPMPDECPTDPNFPPPHH